MLRTILNASLVAHLGLVGCMTTGSASSSAETGTDTEDEVAADDVSERTACTPSALADVDLSFEAGSSNALYNRYSEEWFVSTVSTGGVGDPTTTLRVTPKMYRGSLAGGFGIGLYRIAGEDADPNTCSFCVTLEARNGEETTRFIATSGIVSVTEYDTIDDVFAGAVTDLEFVPFSVEPGDVACESNTLCPGASTCDPDTNTCTVASVDGDACPVPLSVVEL